MEVCYFCSRRIWALVATSFGFRARGHDVDLEKENRSRNPCSKEMYRVSLASESTFKFRYIFWIWFDFICARRLGRPLCRTRPLLLQKGSEDRDRNGRWGGIGAVFCRDETRLGDGDTVLERSGSAGIDSPDPPFSHEYRSCLQKFQKFRPVFPVALSLRFPSHQS